MKTIFCFILTETNIQITFTTIKRIQQNCQNLHKHLSNFVGQQENFSSAALCSVDSLSDFIAVYIYYNVLDILVAGPTVLLCRTRQMSSQTFDYNHEKRRVVTCEACLVSASRSPSCTAPPLPTRGKPELSVSFLIKSVQISARCKY